jgi:S-formylglutathione hydrolase FrmB
MRNTSITFLLIVLIGKLNAATVDTINIYSNAMQKSYKCVVIKPAGYKKSAVPFPVVYLLHGYSGNYASWVKGAELIKKYADEYRLIIVCPDGGFSSWYINSPVDSSYQFETYVGIEIPDYIDKNYKTIKDRTGRAITGLSMGGHGGLYLAFKHSDLFGACGSTSGGVDLRPFPKNWDLTKRLGDTTNFKNNWKDYSVVNVIETKPVMPLSIIIDCGTEDFFYTVNREAHQKLLQLKIPHDYIERPGKHDWLNWRNAIKYQLLYFSNYFNENKNTTSL